VYLLYKAEDEGIFCSELPCVGVYNSMSNLLAGAWCKELCQQDMHQQLNKK